MIDVADKSYLSYQEAVLTILAGLVEKAKFTPIFQMTSKTEGVLLIMNGHMIGGNIHFKFTGPRVDVSLMGERLLVVALNRGNNMHWTLEELSDANDVLGIVIQKWGSVLADLAATAKQAA